MLRSASRGRTAPDALTRLKSEDGFTLSEMFVVIVILGIVVAGLSQLFVSASHTQVDQTNRTDAQQAARLGLVKLRREIRCASALSPNPSGTWPTRSVTVVLGSYCSTYQSGLASVTWCTVGGAAPYELWRYPHTGSYSNACSDTGSGGNRWAKGIVDGGGVTGGNIFTTFAPGAMRAPGLASGSGGSLGGGTYGYVVDPITAAGEQTGTEATIVISSSTATNSVAVSWSGSCPPYSGVTGYKVYGRTLGAENLLLATIASPSTCTFTDTGAGTTAGSPVNGDTLARLGIRLPIRLGTSSNGLFTLTDHIALRNTPR